MTKLMEWAFETLTDDEDVVSLYLVLLGRLPEGSLSQIVHIKKPLRLVMVGILESQELFDNAARAVSNGVLSSHSKLDRQAYIRAAKWVSRVTGVFAPTDLVRWWLLLDIILRLDFLKPTLEKAGLEKFLELVTRRASSEAENYKKIQAFLQLEYNWFIRRNVKAGLALQRGTAGKFEAYFLERGLESGLQLLPAFSENLQDVYRSFKFERDVTVNDVAAATLGAVLDETVSHWLFCNVHYRRMLEFHDDADKRAAPTFGKSNSPYFDFIVYGDGQGYSPHPLFCYYVYRNSMKHTGPPSNRSCFLDYLVVGCFENVETTAIFDSGYYMLMNPAAENAVRAGTHVSALHHFLTVGIFQDLPFSSEFDINFYSARYPDVAVGVRDKAFASVSWHFVFVGLGEGREPNPYFSPSFYRTRHPSVREDMKRLGIASELEHFLLIGRARGFKPEQPAVSRVPAGRVAKAIFRRRARRSFNNVRRAPLDFTAYGSESPSLSIVVPVCGEVEFTSRFLECAYFAAAHLMFTEKAACEIIIVENGSTDLTREVLGACKGIEVVTFDHPIGFPDAVNAGVQRSRGDLIVIANNDIEFMPDIFVKTRARLTNSPEIGIVGGLTILPNESLQEAGSFLDRVGNVVGLGREENPWDEFFQGVHRADYCTGSFIAFRRGDYDAVGGFDETFSPGYYEETDFALRLFKSQGKIAAIDSEIQINHYEHASFSKGRPPSAAYALIKKNQARLLDKHRDVLAGRPSPLQLLTSEGLARPTTLKRTRFLVIEDLIPDQRLGSGFGRSAELLRALSRRGLAYDLLAISANAIVDEFIDPLVKIYRGWMPESQPEAVIKQYGQRYSHVLVCRTHNLSRFAGLLESLREQHGVQILCDTEALSALRLLEMKKIAGRETGRNEELSAVRSELNVPVQVGMWIAVSEYEGGKITEAGFGPVAVIGHRAEAKPAAPRTQWTERRRIMAVGAVHEADVPNHDGLVWFMEHVYPRCEHLFADLTLTLVGYWHPKVRQGFERTYAGIAMDFVGVATAEQLARLYDECRVALAPTRFGAGIAIKVLEAMNLGVPIVMTDLLETQLVGDVATGSTGMAVGLRSDRGETFARWLEELCADETTWKRIRLRQDHILAEVAGAAIFERAVDEVFLRALPEMAR